MPHLCQQGGTNFCREFDIMYPIRRLISLLSTGNIEFGRRSSSSCLTFELGRACGTLHCVSNGKFDVTMNLSIPYQ